MYTKFYSAFQTLVNFTIVSYLDYETHFPAYFSSVFEDFKLSLKKHATDRSLDIEGKNNRDTR